MIVSTRPDGAIVAVLLLFTLYMLGTARCCRSMNVKLNVSSSSFGKRIRKDGGPSLGADSGSYKQCLALLATLEVLKPYLDVLDHTVVPKLSARAIPGRREDIRRDV